ncbi:MAG: NPCBM/NEW2 domain-containing protein [Ruminococcus sp.]|nr:NPCBM/NEW2 domain-containing protein [Ruminococcus sp.]
MKKVLSIILCAVVAVSCLTFSVSAKKVSVKSPKLKSVTQTDLTTAKIKWSKVSGAKGYVLYYSTTGRGYKKLTTTTKKSYTHKKLKNNKKYYYKVKAYKKISGKKKYSKFSNINTFRCTNYLVKLHSAYGVQYFKLYNGIETFNMGGDKCNNGFVLTTSNGNRNAFADFNLKGKYSKIQFTYGYDDSTDTRSQNTLSIVVDDEVIETYELKYGDLPKTVTVNINNANKLEFLATPKIATFGDKIGFVNIKVFK